MAIHVRPIKASDAEAYVELLAWLDNESRYPVVNIIERSLTAGDWRDAIAQFYARGERIILVAEVMADAEVADARAADGQQADAVASEQCRLAGFLSTTSDWFGGVHQLRVVIGIREEYTGQGIGTRLFSALEAWARAAGVRRLHLTVETDNDRALALYHKMGFTIEGYINRAVQIEGQWIDDYVMEKWLDA